MPAEEEKEIKIVNFELLQEIISLYKIPLLFTAAGVILFLSALSIIVKNAHTASDVVFTSESTSSAKSKVIIDVQGAVISPGVYELSEGERISDALVSAGGLSADADRNWIAKNMNKAVKLMDGGKIYIPSLGEYTEGKSQIPALPVGRQMTNDKLNPKSQVQNQLLGVTVGKVNMNTASQKELEDLPGVGPVTAGKIINGRPYQSLDELKTKKIVGNALYDKLKDLIIVE